MTSALCLFILFSPVEILRILRAETRFARSSSPPLQTLQPWTGPPAHLEFTNHPLLAWLVISRSLERLGHLAIGKTNFLLNKLAILPIFK